MTEVEFRAPWGIEQRPDPGPGNSGQPPWSRCSRVGSSGLVGVSPGGKTGR